MIHDKEMNRFVRESERYFRAYLTFADPSLHHYSLLYHVRLLKNSDAEGCDRRAILIHVEQKGRRSEVKFAFSEIDDESAENNLGVNIECLSPNINLSTKVPELSPQCRKQKLAQPSI